MCSAKFREKSIGIKKHMLILTIFLMVIALLVTAPKVWAIPFSITKIIIEVNATAGDAGIQISVDAAGWKILEIFDPNGQKIFDVRGSNSVGAQGVTELFFESAEPSFEEQSLTIRLPSDRLFLLELLRGRINKVKLLSFWLSF